MQPLTYLKTLVSIPSDGIAHPEAEIQTCIRSIGARHFSHCEQAGEIDERRFNLLLHNGLDKVRLLFCCHVDTVQSNAPLDVVVKDDEVHGLGTKDMKGGIAALLAALDNLPNSALRHVGILTYVDEEHKQTGMAKFIECRFQMQPALIVCPESRYNLSAGHRGLLTFDLSVWGKGAHTARPHLGQSAIENYMTVFGVISDHFQSQQHPVLGQSVATLTHIHGGTEGRNGKIIVSDNQVPNLARGRVSVRTVSPVTTEDLIACVQKQLPDVKIEIKIDEVLPPNPIQLETLAELTKLFKQIDPDIEMGDPKLSGFNDASILRQVYDCPVVNFGPLGADNHTDNEWVSLSSINKTTSVFQKLIELYST